MALHEYTKGCIGANYTALHLPNYTGWVAIPGLWKQTNLFIDTTAISKANRGDIRAAWHSLE